MRDIIGLTEETINYFMEKERQGDNVYSITLSEEGDVGMLIGNFNIVFPLYQITGDVLVFEENGINDSVRELLKRMYSLGEDTDNRPLEEVIRDLDDSRFSRLAHTLIWLPTFLIQTLHKLNRHTA